jgi:hypothetical protein
MTCTVCGLDACGLTSHKQLAMEFEADVDVELIATLVRDRHPEVSKEQLIAKALELHPELYEHQGEVSKADRWDAFRRDLFVDLDRLADQLQYENRNLTRAQAVAKAASMRPEVYDQAVLMVAQGAVQHETAR